jgi:UPF0755 protein
MSRIYEWLTTKNRIVYVVILFIIISGFYLYLHSPPNSFPLNSVVTIVPGQTLKEITDELYKAKVIRSPFFFRFHVIVLGGERRVIAGDYLLDRAIGPADLASRLVGGKFHIDTVKVTVPEGWNIFQIAEALDTGLENFDKKTFLALAKNKEGYLFPDTYFLSPKAKPDFIIDLMQRTFNQKILTVPAIATSTHNIKDIIIMSSIIEAEARTTESRRVVSGILWKRLALGLPLQVDSTFSYINGKNTYELTASDLKIDSPYNTYKYAGLPPGPINNPGLDAIVASISPIETKYLYFLSSKSGKMYYATTFAEHKRNRELYLNK